MRNDKKILRLAAQREQSRELYVKTQNKEHLEDMFTLEQMIELEKDKEARILGWVLIAMVGVTISAPWIIWWLGSR